MDESHNGQYDSAKVVSVRSFLGKLTLFREILKFKGKQGNIARIYKEKVKKN